MNSSRIDNAIRADLFRLIDIDPHPGFDFRVDHQRFDANIALRQFDEGGSQRRNHAADHHTADGVPAEATVA
jgi:hypothetical protein